MQNENECNKCNECNQNEFELDGVTYIAKPQYGCEGCSFRISKKECPAVDCRGSHRADSTSVIFVKKPETKPELEKETKMQASEAKQYDVSDKSKEYYDIICDAYDKGEAEVWIGPHSKWQTAYGVKPTNTLQWLIRDWRIKPKNRVVTLEIPEDLEIKGQVSDVRFRDNPVPYYELLFVSKDKEILEKIAKAIQKS